MIIPANGNGNQIEVLTYNPSDIRIVHNDGWISVKEKLPNRYVDVLFQGLSGRMAIGQYQGDNLDGVIYFKEWDEGYKQFMPSICVAWQPLPAPYEGD